MILCFVVVTSTLRIMTASESVNQELNTSATCYDTLILLTW